MLHEIALLDQFVADWLRAHAHGGVTGAMELVSRWHRPLGMWAMTLTMAAVLLWRRDREALWILLLAVPLGSALNHLLKHTIRHARPGSMEVVSETDFGFPSGHVATATLIYGSVAAIVILRATNWGTKAGAVATAATLVAIVAASRLVLGAHHFSDVMAAAAGGVAWLALCVLLVRRCSSRSHGIAGDRSRRG